MHGQTQIKFMEVFECILNEKESEITERTIREWMGPPHIQSETKIKIRIFELLVPSYQK
jgi:hypothetical protein